MQKSSIQLICLVNVHLGRLQLACMDLCWVPLGLPYGVRKKKIYITSVHRKHELAFWICGTIILCLPSSVHHGSCSSKFYALDQPSGFRLKWVIGQHTTQKCINLQLPIISLSVCQRESVRYFLTTKPFSSTGPVPFLFSLFLLLHCSCHFLLHLNTMSCQWPASHVERLQYMTLAISFWCLHVVL